jgi:hypothetical protein
MGPCKLSFSKMETQTPKNTRTRERPRSILGNHRHALKELKSSLEDGENTLVLRVSDVHIDWCQ